MNTITTISLLRDTVRQARSKGQRIALVPTMGYLHEGHAALVDAARQESDIVIASLFVNPLQFGPTEDFEAYPRNPERDAQVLQQHGCDILFAPSVEEMYPVPMATHVELTDLGQALCGRSRPTHFRGVTTVVTKLFNIVQPDRAYFGQKDGQQAAIIRRMVQDLNLPVEIVTVPTVREEDGLAKSSRNVYLSERDRQHATVLFRALQTGKEALTEGERDGAKIARAMQSVLDSEPDVKLDYAEVVYLGDLRPATTVEGQVMLAVAAYVGKARLIDNFQLEVTPTQVIDLYGTNVPVHQ